MENSAQTFIVDGMTCGGCAKIVTATLKGLPGITHVETDPETATVTITTDRYVDRDAIAQALRSEEFDLK